MIPDRWVELLVEAVLFLSGEALIPELTFRALPEPKRSVGSSNLAKLGLRCTVAEEYELEQHPKVCPTCGFLPDLEATLDLAPKTEGRLED